MRFLYTSYGKILIDINIKPYVKTVINITSYFTLQSPCFCSKCLEQPCLVYQTAQLSLEMTGLEHWFSKFSYSSEFPGGLVKTQIDKPHSVVYDSVSLAWNPIICISNKFSGDAGLASSRTILLEPLAQNTLSIRK